MNLEATHAFKDRKISRSTRREREGKWKTKGDTSQLQGARGEELEGDTGRLGGKAPGSIGESAIQQESLLGDATAANANGTQYDGHQS